MKIHVIGNVQGTNCIAGPIHTVCMMFRVLRKVDVSFVACFCATCVNTPAGNNFCAKLQETEGTFCLPQGSNTSHFLLLFDSCAFIRDETRTGRGRGSHGGRCGGPRHSWIRQKGRQRRLPYRLKQDMKLASEEESA